MLFSLRGTLIFARNALLKLSRLIAAHKQGKSRVCVRCQYSYFKGSTLRQFGRATIVPRKPLLRNWNVTYSIEVNHMKRNGLLFLIAALVLLWLGTMLVKSPQVQAQNDDNQGNQSNDEESKIKQGFAIAPVPLNLDGKNRALVGLGSYIVNAQGGCNGCHTLNPGVEYTSDGNPYLLSPPFSGKVTVDPTHYLAGGNDFGPFPGGPGSIPHLYTRNLTPDKTGRPEGGHTFEEFVQIIRHGTDFDHIHPSCTGPGTPANCLPFPFNGDLLQVMPWPVYTNMTDRDLLAIYTYLSAIPCNPGPSGLDPTLYEQNVCE
jgi:hypothetical protein